MDEQKGQGKRWVLSALVGLVYALAFPFLYAFMHQNTPMLGVLPVLTAAALLGVRGGVAAEVIICLYDFGMMSWILDDAEQARTIGFALGHTMTLGLAYGTAWLVGIQKRALAAEAHLAQERARLDAVLLSSAEAIAGIGADGRIRFLSAAAPTILGVSDSAVGSPISEVVVAAPGRPGPPGPSLSGTPSDRSRSEIVLPDGQKRPVEWWAAATGDPAVPLALFIRDITRQLEVEDTLKVETARARTRSREKSAFLANMSHEIRTPLAGMLGMVELLDNPDLEQKQRENIRLLRHSADQLRAIIGDLLDLSRMEAGRLELDLHPVNIRELADEMARLGRASAPEGVEVTALVADPVPLLVLADGMRLRQMCGNLINNACRFTTEGSIRLEVSNVSESRDTPQIRFSITDTGVGIAPTIAPTLFEQYRQADASVAASSGGSGLGLAIVKELAELMKGTVGVESTQGIGSTFWFEVGLLVTATQTEATPMPRRHGLEGLHILVAEDNDVNQLVIKGLLTRAGCTMELVENGALATQRMREDSYDLVLMDCQMPVMDGYEATRAIRQQETPDTHVPIVALTAYATDRDRKRCLAAGMDEYLTKPITLERLVAAISEVLSRPKTVVEEPPMTQGWVLVVDDEPATRSVVRSELSGWGLQVGEAQTSDDARTLLQRQPEAYPVIVIDEGLGRDNDGIELARHIRQTLGTQPAIVVIGPTAGSGPWMEAGVDLCAAKPVDWPALHARVVTMVEEARTAKQWQREVLVVDDQLVGRKVMMGLLQTLDVQGRQAETGEEAAALCADNEFLVVFMDLQMPGMNGFETTRAIRQTETGRRQRIWALSAEDDPSERQKCLTAGMDGFLSKPISRDILRQTLKQVWSP